MDQKYPVTDCLGPAMANVHYWFMIPSLSGTSNNHHTDLWYRHGTWDNNDQLVVELLFRTSNNGPDLQYLHAKSFLFLSLGVATIVIFIILLPLCIVSVSMPPAHVHLLLKGGEHGVFDAFSNHCLFWIHRGKNSWKTIRHLAASTIQERNHGHMSSYSLVLASQSCVSAWVCSTDHHVFSYWTPGHGLLDMRIDLSTCCTHGGQTDTDQHICWDGTEKVPQPVSTGAK